MNLKKRAIEGILVASSLVMMCAIAETAGTVANQKADVAVETRTDLATRRTAGVVASLDQVEADAFEEIAMVTVDIERTQNAVVAAAQTAQEQTVEEAVTVLLSEEQIVKEEAAALGEEQTVEEVVTVAADSEEQTVEEAVTVAADSEEQAVKEEAVAALSEEQTVEEAVTVAADSEKQAVEQAASALSEEQILWQNRLMADVQEFLYVRAAGDENAEIVGKLYKGDMAEIVENGETWTHVVSGNVDGYVKNDYCVFGLEAFDYATATFDTEAEIQTDGLRVRSGASEEASVIAAVSTGTSLTVNLDAEQVDGWVAVNYGGESGYVSAEYVSTELALGEGITIKEEREEQERLAKQKAEAEAAQVASSGTVQSSAVAASADDVTLLAALIQCEAGSECYEGQLAVGAVVMNRIKSGRYASTVYNVIYQPGQFTPAGSGSVANVIARGPSASCVQAAQAAISGMDNTGGALHFRRASSGQPGVVIGNHVFY